MRGIDLIIFDCDGVLVDSEPLAMQVLLRTLAAEGLTLDRQQAFRDFLGRSLAAMTETLAADYGLVLGREALERMRADLYRLFRAELQPIAGVAEAIAALDVPFCVASSSHLERIRLSLEVTGLLPLFEGRIFSASMVRHGKPAPDLFLHAAREMGVAPERCLVIEDSPAGIAAARAAKMAVFAFLGGGHVAPSGLEATIAALGPDAAFAAMAELPQRLAALAPPPPPAAPLLVGVDVGTASARAGVVTAEGRLLSRAEAPVEMRRIGAAGAEHDSRQIWQAVCTAVRRALELAAARPEDVVGIAFDATCSLVLRDRDGAPLPVSDAVGFDTFVWLDHRAMAEAEAATATGHPALAHVGGVVSPEMELPKLMWFKRHRPEGWAKLGLAFDLADFLSWQATGSTQRSQSTLTSKWNFLAHREQGWPADFHAAIGLDDLVARCGLPERPLPIGGRIGPLTPEAASALGLTTNCVVAAGLVDAHAGALGLIGDAGSGEGTAVALIGGTSNSILTMSTEERFLHGVWGPFLGAVLPGQWLQEAGQSAAGALLDHIIRLGGETATPAAHARIVARIAELRALDPDLASGLHVLPDFHGNRSPLADPEAFGIVAGLTLESGFDALCKLYWRSAVGLALGLRQILEALGTVGLGAGTVHAGGGHSKNAMLMQLYADVTGRPIAISRCDDPVLLGTAIAAAAGAGLYPDPAAAARAMCHAGEAYMPDPARTRAHERDYRAMLALQRHSRELRALTAE